MSYVALDTQIRAVLAGISALNAVYDHEVKELKKYPAAAVSPQEHNNQPGDTAANIRIFTFVIRLYIRIDENDDYEANMRSLVDSVLTALEANPTLNSSCDFHKATKGKWAVQERETGLLRVVEITLDAYKRVLR